MLSIPKIFAVLILANAALISWTSMVLKLNLALFYVNFIFTCKKRIGGLHWSSNCLKFTGITRQRCKIRSKFSISISISIVSLAIERKSGGWFSCGSSAILRTSRYNSLYWRLAFFNHSSPAHVQQIRRHCARSIKAARAAPKSGQINRTSGSICAIFMILW